MTTATATAVEAAAGKANAAPAVSARILKKRETDRRCQRMIRERTKSRIAYLEGLVEQFRQQDSSGRVETLMKQLADMKDDRDTLAKKVKTIESIISDSKLKEEPDTQDLVLSTHRPDPDSPTPLLTIDTRQVTHHSHPVSSELTSSSPLETPFYQLHNKEYAAYIESSSRSSWSASTLQPASNQPCECSTHFSALDPTKTLNKWRYANDTLTEWFKWSPQALDMSKYEAYNDDVPVRAMVEGWDAVEKFGRMHPAWKLLRGIDETIFGSLDRRERLAIVSVMGMLLQAHLNPTTDQHRKLPAFYLKRPSQDMLHSYATEYFAWPGLRERFVFSEHRYCSNIFWRVFCKSLRFQWQYEFRDCYVRNTETGLYKISPTFYDRIHDIRSWTMGMDMFKQYPELYGDIPAWNHIPASLAPVVSATRHALRSFPSNTSAPDTRKTSHADDTDIAHSQDMHQSSTQLTSQVNTSITQQAQSTYPQYPATPSHGSFESPTPPLSSYDFTPSGMVTTMAEMNQIPPMNSWGYSTNLDMFQFNPP